jgi:hypothetical protein
MHITDREKQIVERAEAELTAAGAEDIGKLWIQRGVGLIVSTSCHEHKIEQLEEVMDFVQACLADARKVN